MDAAADGSVATTSAKRERERRVFVGEVVRRVKAMHLAVRVRVYIRRCWESFIWKICVCSCDRRWCDDCGVGCIKYISCLAAAQNLMVEK